MGATAKQGAAGIDRQHGIRAGPRQRAQRRVADLVEQRRVVLLRERAQLLITAQGEFGASRRGRCAQSKSYDVGTVVAGFEG
jgi:hypothetical protein